MATKRTIKRSTETYVLSIGAALDEFIEEKQANNLAAKTINNYLQSIGYFLDFNELTRDSEVTEINQSQIFKWINTLKLEGVSPNSINHYLRDTRTFLYWCMAEERGYITPFKIKQVQAQEETPKLFSDEDLILLTEHPQRNNNRFTDWRNWAIVSWVLGTGNRAATIVEVKINDIDFRKKEITLAHTKNKKAQVLPLSSALEAVLKEYIKTWRADAPKDAYLFCNVGEEKLTTNALQNSFAKYCKEKGVSHTNIHGLRHNLAKNWVMTNGNQFKLQKVLGHSTLDMTKRYVNLFSEDVKEGYDSHSALDTIARKKRRTQAVKKNPWDD